MGTIEVVLGDIRAERVDAIVTAANESLLGGGVDGAIHTVGPVWEGGDQGGDEVLTNCYLNSLQLAAELHAGSIAFPAIATGIYGFPAEQAARVATRAVRSLPIIDRIRLVAFDEETCRALTAGLAEPA